MFRIYSWIYRGSLGFFILLAVCFAAVLPIDSIAQASASENDALNTFIVVGALVFFAIICITIVTARIIYYKSCVIDIPRRYIPITDDDLPHAPSRNYLLDNMDKSHELSILFKKPNQSIIHDGLEPPQRCDLSLEEKLFPDYLNYENCMKIVANRIKYQGFFLAIVDVNLKLQDTFTDIITKQFIATNNNKTQVEKATRFIEIYEYLQFSGKPINRKSFTEFVELCIYFADIITSTDKSKNLHLTKTKSNLSLRHHRNQKNQHRKRRNNFSREDFTQHEKSKDTSSKILSPFHTIDTHSASSDYAPDEVQYFPRDANHDLNLSSSKTDTSYNDTQEAISAISVQPTTHRNSLKISPDINSGDANFNDRESKFSKQESSNTVIIHR